MGFPSEGAEGIYRNAMSEVLAFLNMFHKNHYKVFNLCAERTYDPAKLGGNVEWIPFSDHNPAPTEIMFHFCEHAGRTGLMICAYLLYSRECSDPVTAIQHYGEKRMKNGKGVTIPSQRRYLFYFYDLWKHGPRNLVPLVISKIIFYSSISIKCDIQVCIACNSGNGSFKLNPILESEHAGSVTNLVREGKYTTFFFSDVHISGDVKVTVYNARSSEKPIFYFWFNTAFVDGKLFSLASTLELDKPSKYLDDDTKVHVFFSSRPRQGSTRENGATVDAEMKAIEQLTKQLSSINKVSSSMLK